LAKGDLQKICEYAGNTTKLRVILLLGVNRDLAKSELDILEPSEIRNLVSMNK